MKRKSCRFPLVLYSGRVGIPALDFLKCIQMIIKMNSRFLLGMLCLIGVAFMPVKASAAKIAYVDARVLIDEAPQGKYEARMLEQEFSERSRDLKAKIELFNTKEAEFQKNAVLLSSEEINEQTEELRELQRTLQREQQNYNEDYTRSRNKGLARLEKLISEVIIEIAQREKIDLVLQQAVYASREIDLTDKILEELSEIYSQ